MWRKSLCRAERAQAGNGETGVEQEEIALIASADLRRYPQLEAARDLFMFSFYCRGMSFVDVIRLKHDGIVRDTIFYTRSKTGQRLQIGLLPAMKEIIEKYRTSGPYIFPYIHGQSPRDAYTQYRYSLGTVNRYLKRLGTLLNIGIPLTTYVARHSWATIAKNEGIPISLISEGLGHTSEKTTQIYLNSFAVDTLNKVNENVRMPYRIVLKMQVKNSSVYITQIKPKKRLK